MRPREELIDVVWAVVVIQGAITLLSFLEALVAGATQGVALVPILVLTGGGGCLALASARGLRNRRRWARRVTLVAESLVLLVGTINLVASLALTQQVDLVPVLTTIVAPVAVIVLLRRSRQAYTAPPAVAEEAVA